MIPEFCPVLGIKIKIGNNGIKFDSPTLDKIIPELGYIKGNVKIISHKANRLKSNGKLLDFKNIIAYLEENIDCNIDYEI